MKDKKEKILGVKINKEAICDILSFLEKKLKEKNGKKIKIFTPNSEIILMAQKDEKFKEILNSADISLPDSTGVVLASKILKKNIKRRIPGSDFFVSLCALAEKTKARVFLLGGKGVAQKTKEKLKSLFPKIQIVSFSEDLNLCYNHIKSSCPDIVFVALGAPKQEKWIYENIEKFPSVKIMMVVGGSFDMLSGKRKRAPKIMRKYGLEWLWRLILEPKRIKRIIKAVIIFPIFVLKEKIK